MVSKFPLTKRSNQVAEYFESLIRQGIYKQGDKLPTLAEMAKVLQVSKSTIREGLAVLVAQGLIDVRHGSGYFVRNSPPEIQEGGVEPRDLGQVLFVRLLLEVPAAKLAAQNRMEEHLYGMVKTLDQMRIGPMEKAVAADLEFHMAIADASQNAVLREVIRSLSSPMQYTMKYSRAIAGIDSDLYQKHADLFAAIRDGDSKKSERLMHAHLYDTAERLKILVPESWALVPFPPDSHLD